MDFLRKYKKFRLQYREKVSNLVFNQIIRSLKMLARFPLRSFQGGVLKAMINVTYKCQCNCDYCWCGNYSLNNQSELSLQQMKLVIDQIATFPSLATLVSFVGGEPLLREDIYELVRYAAAKGLFTEMETNGILLSHACVLKLKRAGLSHLFVRIEGSTADKHDTISRINGCFQKAIEGIKNCKEANLSCSIFMNASRAKVREDELSKIINLAKKLGVKSARIIFPVLSGKWLTSLSQRLTDEEENKVKELLEPGFVYLEASDACFKKTARICAAGQKKFFHISCYGEVQPCPFVPISFGSLPGQQLKQVLAKMWEHPIFKKGYSGCLMNNDSFRKEYIFPSLLMKDYKNIKL